MNNRASAPIRVRNVIKATLSRPIAFHPVFAQICERSINAGLMLSQAFYWSERTDDSEGWFWKDSKQWQDETCMSKHEIVTARTILRRLGLMEEKLAGTPPVLHFRVNFDGLCSAIDEFAGKRQINLPDSGKLKYPESGKSNNRNSGKQFTGKQQINSPEPGKTSLLGSESTTETTAESTSAPTPEIFINLPLADDSEMAIAKSQVAEWVDLYPGIDVEQQLRNMRGWLKANRKPWSREVAMRQTNRWLMEEQSRVPKQAKSEHPVEPVKARAPIVLPPLDIAGVEAFEIVRDHLRAKISRHSFDTWIKPLRCAGRFEDKLYVIVPTEEFKHVDMKYSDLIAEALPQGYADILFYTADEVAR